MVLYSPCAEPALRQASKQAIFSVEDPRESGIAIGQLGLLKINEHPAAGLNPYSDTATEQREQDEATEQQ